MKVFIEAESGSCDKGMYNEKTFEKLSVRTAIVPYPYGFILNTSTDDGDGVDCYVITKAGLKESSKVDCEIIGLLEFFEGEERDHKVLSCLPEEGIELTKELREELKEFIETIFSKYPEVQIRVGSLLSRETALNFIQKHRI